LSKDIPKRPEAEEPTSALSSALVHTHETTAVDPPHWRVPFDQRKRRYAPATECRIQRREIFPALTEREEEFRHGGWRATRAKVLSALYMCHQSEGRIKRFKACGSNVKTFWSPSERKFFQRGDYCHDRLCIPCGTAKGCCIAHNLQKLTEGVEIRFATVTLRTKDEPLLQTMDRLLTAFRRLQESELWTACVDGGARFIEVKRGKRKTNWHCHIHLLLVGRYMPQKELSRAWAKASKGSFVVDIRPVPDKGNIIGYVTKYVAKPLDPSVYENAADLRECLIALKGRRLCATFGNWRGTELEAKEPAPEDLSDVGPLDAILRLASEGDKMAMLVIATIRPPRVVAEADRKARDRGG